MKWIEVGALLVASLSTAPAARAQPTLPTPLGEEYEITLSYETSGSDSDGGSSSTSGHDRILERVIAVGETGLQLEYDLPKDATAEERAREWRFPARILIPRGGSTQLLNPEELEARVERWLKAAKLDRSACGRWIFTWNLFQIECDPQSVLKTLHAFDLRSVVARDGAPYRVAEALAPGTLARKAAEPDGATFQATMEIDPEAVRRARAESDVVVGQFMGKPVTLEAALAERAKENVSGTISVTLETDSSGAVRRRIQVTKVETRGADGGTKSDTRTETTERRPASRPGGEARNAAIAATVLP